MPIKFSPDKIVENSLIFFFEHIVVKSSNSEVKKSKIPIFGFKFVLWVG